MEFNKYKELGAYHWEEWEQNTIYGQHANKVSNWIKEKNVLDIGAGDGLITHLLTLKNINCIGIDDNDLAVELARNKGARVQLGDAYNLLFPSNYFDAVLMADVIEHFEFPTTAIEEVKRVLKKDGVFYITTPPRKATGLHDKYHYREYTDKELQEYVESLGFKLMEPIENKYVRLYAKFQKL